MKITKHRLRRLIREVWQDAPVSDRDIVDALRGTWEEVRLDVGIPNPTAEEKSDEAMAMMKTYFPREADALHYKSNTEKDELLWTAFTDRGSA